MDATDHAQDRDGGAEADAAAKILRSTSASPIDQTTRQPHPIRMQPLVEAILTHLQPVIAAYEAEVVLPTAWPRALGHEPSITQRWTEDIRTAIVHSGRQSRIELGSSLVHGGRIRFWVRTQRCALSFTLPAALRADQPADG